MGSDPFFVSLFEKILIYPFLVQIIHDLSSLLVQKRVNVERGLLPFIFDLSIWVPPLKTKIFDTP